MATTRTGSFPIGIRAAGRMELNAAMIDFLQANDFEAVDTGEASPKQIKQIVDAGIKIGSVDLKTPWQNLLDPDEGKRCEAVDMQAQFISELTPLGVRQFFLVLLPPDPASNRQTNFEHAVSSLGRLGEAIRKTDARIVLEGYPGGWPHFPALACTPESCRAIFDRLPDSPIGVNYDPSHLVRMDIDPVRFLEEFAARVYHVHAKDTEIFDDALYEFGNLQPATFAKRHGFGSHHWRYTIPGHGATPWTRLLKILERTGYSGALSIELEDENFTGDEERIKQGFIAARDFLMHA